MAFTLCCSSSSMKILQIKIPFPIQDFPVPVWGRSLKEIYTKLHRLPRIRCFQRTVTFERLYTSLFMKRMPLSTFYVDEDRATTNNNSTQRSENIAMECIECLL